MSTDVKTEIVNRPAEIAVHHDAGPLASILDTNLFNHLWRVATAYSRSAMVPQVFRGKPDDCFVAVQLALRLEVDPFMLMQSMYVVHGKPGMEAKLAIALCNSRGPFSDRIAWKFQGLAMERSCTAYAHDRATGNVCECTVTMKIAKAEGWIDKEGSKWRTMPDQMLMYRSAAWLIRTSCPEVLMGMATSEELHDITIRGRDAELPDRAALNELLTAENGVSVEPSDTPGQGSAREPRISGSPSPASAAVESPQEDQGETDTRPQDNSAAPPPAPPAALLSPRQEYEQRAAECETMKDLNALVAAAGNDDRLTKLDPDACQAILDTLTGRRAIIRQQLAAKNRGAKA